MIRQGYKEIVDDLEKYIISCEEQLKLINPSTLELFTGDYIDFSKAETSQKNTVEILHGAITAAFEILIQNRVLNSNRADAILEIFDKSKSNQRDLISSLRMILGYLKAYEKILPIK